MENGFVFHDCIFENLNEIMRNDGSVLGDSSGFDGCWFNNVKSVLVLNNQQAVGIDIIDCDGVLRGPLIKILGKAGGAGGNVNVYGGNFKVSLGELVAIDNAGVGPFTQPINLSGVRVELSNTGKLFNVTGRSGATSHLNIDNSTVLTTKPGPLTRIVGSMVSNAVVNFNRCNIAANCQFDFNSLATPTTVLNMGLLTFDQCAVSSTLSDNIFFNNGVGRARAMDCFGVQVNPAATPNQNSALSFELNIFRDGGLHNSNIALKQCLLFNPHVSNWPTATANPEKTLLLPKGALIKGIRLVKPAGGSVTTPYQIFVGNNAKSAIYGRSISGPTNSQHFIDVQFAANQIIDTSLPGKDRTVRIWASGGGSTAMKGGLAIVEYY